LKDISKIEVGLQPARNLHPIISQLALTGGGRGLFPALGELMLVQADLGPNYLPVSVRTLFTLIGPVLAATGSVQKIERSHSKVPALSLYPAVYALSVSILAIF
jgi:hypothetical protein